MSKPDGYPLPWCDFADKPYYSINLYLCLTNPEWRKRQAYIPMATVIPWIDELIEKGELEFLKNAPPTPST